MTQQQKAWGLITGEWEQGFNASQGPFLFSQQEGSNKDTQNEKTKAMGSSLA